jgi:hypothetical protein
MTQRKSSFSEEFAIIPKVMYLFCAAAFVGILFLFLSVMPQHDPHSPPFAARVCLSVLLGIVVSTYFLLIGYVNQDAKRRDMSQFGWTLVVVLFFNGLGPLVYFLLRKPLTQYCPKCGERAERGFHFCAKCGCELTPSCGSCGREVSRDFVVCPYCGKALGAAPTA